MSITGRINALFAAAAVLLCCAITVYIAQREYGVALERLLEDSRARVASRPFLRVHVYNRDEASLQKLLDFYLEPPALAIGAVYDSLGSMLAKRQHNANLSLAAPSFKLLRENLSPTDSGLAAFDSAMQPLGIGLWSSLLHRDSVINLSLPVFSPVNPTKKGLGPVDFFQSDTSSGTGGSLVVMGYLYLGIDRNELLLAMQPAVSQAFITGLLLVVICVVAVLLATRRITAQLSGLARLADKVVSGEVAEHVEIEGSQELKDIANVLNGVIGGVSNYRRELDVDHKLLALRENEKASQLSEQTSKLDKAQEEIRETRGQLHQMANYDSLTALPNRRLFTEQLGLLLRLVERERKPLALLVLNLDNFKRINDSLGHNVGDMLLQKVAKRLAGCLRASDMLSHDAEPGAQIDLSRLEGDEFTIVLNQLDRIDSAAQVAQRLAEKLVEPVLIDGQELLVTPSIGIAVAPRDATTVDELLRAANVALYHARSVVNRRFLFYKNDMESTGPDHFKLESELRKAVDRNQLQLHFQPQIDSTDGSIVAAEALLRWEHPEFGQVPPLKFIPMAEEIGLIDGLGDWVLVEACRQMKAFRQQGLAMPRIAINVSRLQFGVGFVAKIEDLLLQSELPPGMLELELSESLLTNNDADTLKAIKALNEMGVYLSVDDFGAGCAPLGYLSRYPLDEIKIDRSFVRDCDRRADSARLVRAIIAMAGSLELRVVAEGVETEGEYQFLTGHGVRMLQGYLFSKPIPATELQQLLKVKWHFLQQIQQIAMSAEAASREFAEASS